MVCRQIDGYVLQIQIPTLEGNNVTIYIIF